jgi:dihydroneopterin aldolase
MTSLLASVTGPAEAAIALDAGADIIDLKDPSAGAFGAVTEAVVRATVRAVAGRRPVSAVTGDLPPDPPLVVPAAQAMAATGVDYVKIGLFAQKGAADCIAALADLARRTRLVAVLFADRAPDFSLLPVLAEAGFHAVMLDTADKSGKRLLDHLDIPALARFVAAAHGAGLRAGLAGALEAPDVPRLLVLRPDILGFRGALCAGRRAGAIDADATRAIRALIPREDTAEPPPAVDFRLLAARFYAPEPDADRAVTDRVFVHDFILPVSIGAYAFEHQAKQRVRFDVEALVVRAARPARDIADIFSYDLITDGIRLLVDSGHFALAETLAERIAAVVLAHPRVLKATVRVTKLDVGHGALGVEIERQRQAAQPASADVTPLPRRG